MPPHNGPKTTSHWNRYPTPDGPPPTQFWVDSPLKMKRSTLPADSTSDQPAHPVKNAPAKGRPDDSLPVRAQRSIPANAKKQELRFFNVTDPRELKDRSQLRLNRQHVMQNFLSKERQKPSGQRDVRVDGAGAAIKRKRSRIRMPTPFAVDPAADSQVPATRRNLPSPPESSCASDREVERRDASSRLRINEQKRGRQTTQTDGRDNQQLGKGLNGTWASSRYLETSWQDVPFPHNATATSNSPDSTIGASLNPFNTWPTFSDESIDVTRLKWSCSRRFGSERIAIAWVPELLRARHAFLSTICISSAHDDIMSRAVQPSPPPWLSTREGVERLRVRSEIISLVNQSLKDPELRIADATIIAVLHLLNSEIMGCDDRVMKTHQDGLHRMVRQRGGLNRLGVQGQLAMILTITMYMISVLRESPPHNEFIAYASRHANPMPRDTETTLPESPIYCRPSGFHTVSTQSCSSRETWDLLNTLRELTKYFFQLHSPGQHNATRPRSSGEALISLRDRIFTLPAASSPSLSFPDMHSRHIYESLRLAGLHYAHALATRTPFSIASTQLTSGTATTSDGAWPPGLSATESLQIQLRAVLLKTDSSAVWGPLAGVLFFIALVGGAGANPGPLAQEERVGVEEDARKFLAAIAVRCSIVLSFEYGTHVLEMLRRLVSVETVLNEGMPRTEGPGKEEENVLQVERVAVPETWAQGLWTSEPGVGTFLNGLEVMGPVTPHVQHHREPGWTQMADFARDFEGLG